MTQIVETIELRHGEITIYDNRDYVLIEGDPASEEATSTYYGAGHGPEEYQLLVERIVANHELMEETRAARGTGELPPARAAVRGMPYEDEAGVPWHMRSSTSRFRSDLRLADPRSGEEERTRRQRLALTFRLGAELGRMHGHLQFLIATQAREPRYTPIFMPGDAGASRSQMQPSDLQQAILAGLVVDSASGPYIADLRRGLHNDIVDTLAEELPGFEEQYNNSYELSSEAAWDGVLLDLLLTVIDILEALISFGASIAVTLMRRSLRTSAGVLRREAARRGTRAALGSGDELAERGMRSGADEVLEPDAVIRTSDVPADAIDATPRARGETGADAPAPRGDAPEGEGTALARRGDGEGTHGAGPAPARETPLLGSGAPEGESASLVPSAVERALVEYHGPVARGARETALREIFGAERLRNLLAGFRLLDERLSGAIGRVFRRTRGGRGLVPAAPDAALDRLRTRLRAIIPDRAPRSTDALSATQRSTAISILAEARGIARRRWNTLRDRLWRELYRDEEVRTVLRQMESDGLIRLPRGFPNSDSAPRALAANRDGVIWLRTSEGVPAAQVGRELGISASAVETRLTAIRRAMAAGERAPPLTRELPLNLDHITPVQMNPWNFFDPNNLRVLTASFNDTWLRIFQMRSAFPMTDDALEAWVRSFNLW